MEKNKVLYISYTGMGEALGASQVLSYLLDLSKEYSIYLISLEKIEDLNNQSKMLKISKEMQASAINWYPLEYKSGVKGYIPNYITVYKTAKGLIKDEGITLLHCRSYRSTIVAYFLKKKYLFIGYIFDTRGFWFDEKADVGAISKNGVIYKILKKVEKKIYLDAYHITTLSYVGKDTIVDGQLFDGCRKKEDITVIPTCVDLQSFTQREFTKKDKITIGYVGNVGGWYDFEATVKVLCYIRKQINCDFLFLNRGQHDYIRSQMQEMGFAEGTDYKIEAVDFCDVPAKMSEIDIALFFIHPFFSKRASAATKMGELLATGIPIITNAHVGDHEYIINKYKVGCIIDVEKIGEYDYERIIKELYNKEVSNQCRITSESYFSLKEGVKGYSNIYKKFFYDQSINIRP